MKKKIRFKLRNDLAVPFWIAVFTCLLGAALNSHLFYKSFFRALSKLNEEPIAKITFKYKTAQRKFIDRVVWDRLRQNSPVYNGDMIHTAELSEATIWFDDGTILDLSENTMAQVFKHEDGSLGADLEQGNVSIDSSGESAGLTLTAANVSVEVKAGTALQAQKPAESRDVNLSVQKGTAQLADGTTLDKDNSLTIGEEAVRVPDFTVQYPAANEKRLYHTQEPAKVDFAWNTTGESSKLTLTLARDRNFTNSVQKIDVLGLEQISVDMDKGSWYWKLASENEEKTGRIQMIQALKPDLIVPAADYSYLYRKKTPSLRFIWTESESATAYHFAVSRTPDMANPIFEQRTSATSIIISTLEGGEYWWQVTPYYVVNRTGLANPSEVKSFKIEQRGELIKPELLIPADGDFVNKNSPNVTLSWKMETEAVQYKVTISENDTLRGGNPISFTTSENYITLNQSTLKKFRDGQYYWAVKQVDSEGNESENSAVRSFYALNGSIVQRTVFPPEGYSIWKPLLTDARFTWKTNLNFAHRIQIARDKSFNDIAFETTTSNTSYTGVELDEGTYYWRIKADNGTFASTSPVKTLSVVSELKAPLQLAPTLDKRAVVRPGTDYTFKWKATDEADYYRVAIYKSGSDTPLYDQNFISEEEVNINFDDYEDGLYSWEVRAYTNETELSSRRSGKCARTDFKLRKIVPVRLVSPANNQRFDGWDALEKPPVLEWKSNEGFKDAYITLKKVSGIEMEDKKFPQRTPGQKLEKNTLSSGTYEWTVNASTLDELDISATQPFYFIVDEIKPNDAPEKAGTKDGDYFNTQYFRTTPYIDFEWSKISRANAYILEIQNKKKTVIKEMLYGEDNTNYRLEQIAKLEKGKFNWSIKGVTINEMTKKIIIDGAAASGIFTIDYTLTKSGGKRKKNGDFYGQ